MMSGAKKMVPKRRFKEFLNAGDWEQRKLDEVFQIIDGDRGKNYPGPSDFLSNGDVLFLDTGNVRKDGFNFDNKRYIDFKRDQLLRNGRLILGDYVLTSRGTLGNLAYYSQSIYDIYPHIRINSAMLILRVLNTIKVNNLYLYITLRSNIINEFMKHNFVGSAQPHITKKEFSSVFLPIPQQLEEQKMIGDFFDHLENIITLHQRKLDKLQATKKALLQEMFPEEGQDKPKRRFKGFADAWEQRKLDELTISIGDGLHGTPKYDENGSYYFINGNNLVDSKVSVTEETKKVAFEALSNDDRQLDSTSILMSINGTIGTLARYNNENIMLGKSVAYITPKNINRDFLFYQLQGNVIQSYFYKNLTGTTIKNLGLGTIKNAIVMSTLSEEESKIGQFFYKLDQYITLHQRKLDKLKNLKQAYLNEMFV